MEFSRPFWHKNVFFRRPSFSVPTGSRSCFPGRPASARSAPPRHPEPRVPHRPLAQACLPVREPSLRGSRFRRKAGTTYLHQFSLLFKRTRAPSVPPVRLDTQKPSEWTHSRIPPSPPAPAPGSPGLRVPAPRRRARAPHLPAQVSLGRGGAGSKLKGE